MWLKINENSYINSKFIKWIHIKPAYCGTGYNIIGYMNYSYWEEGAIDEFFITSYDTKAEAEKALEELMERLKKADE